MHKVVPLWRADDRAQMPEVTKQLVCTQFALPDRPQHAMQLVNRQHVGRRVMRPERDVDRKEQRKYELRIVGTRNYTLVWMTPCGCLVNYDLGLLYQQLSTPSERPRTRHGDWAVDFQIDHRGSWRTPEGKTGRPFGSEFKIVLPLAGDR
jgi:hypothetical protein